MGSGGPTYDGRRCGWIDSTFVVWRSPRPQEMAITRKSGLMRGIRKAGAIS
jgi:hypothetical protein